MNLAEYLRAIQIAQHELAQATNTAQANYAHAMQDAQEAFIGDVSFAPLPPDQLAAGNGDSWAERGPTPEHPARPEIAHEEMPQGARGFMD